MRSEQGFFAGRSFVGLTFLSWCVGAAGCSDSIRLSRARTTELVGQYAKRHDTVIWRSSRRYRLQPENRAELKLGDQPALSAPLDQLGTDGKKVVFPDGTYADPEELESAQLVIHGEPLTRLESEGPYEHSERFLAGASVGGSGFCQMIFRVRMAGPLHFEVGGMLFPHAPWWRGDKANGSVGILVDVPVTGPLTLYGGGGLGGAFRISTDRDGCYRHADGSCAGPATTVDTLTFFNARVGIGYRLLQSHVRLGLDGGVWYGKHVKDRRTGDWEPDDENTVLTPMAGFSALYEL
jgi:hypothetical protein